MTGQKYTFICMYILWFNVLGLKTSVASSDMHFSMFEQNKDKQHKVFPRPRNCNIKLNHKKGQYAIWVINWDTTPFIIFHSRL